MSMIDAFISTTGDEGMVDLPTIEPACYGEAGVDILYTVDTEAHATPAIQFPLRGSPALEAEDLAFVRACREHLGRGLKQEG